MPVTPRLTIPESELEISFLTSGGPGGQHANRSATGVSMVWNFRASRIIDDTAKERLAAGLDSRGKGGSIRVVADNSRSQWRNRSKARAQLAELLRAALVVKTPRRPTKPSRAAHRRRLDAKRRRGDAKRLRKRPEID
ncbi:MAG: aminoacyl-tRNA hydrolase [bacterium]|nr:aminoacyl-tRNA hydrolase [bacterium]